MEDNQENNEINENCDLGEMNFHSIAREFKSGNELNSFPILFYMLKFYIYADVSKFDPPRNYYCPVCT